MRTFKRIAYYVVSIAVVFMSSYCMSVFFLIAFNYGKGIQNNEDGILCIPLGFLLIGLALVIDGLFVRKALKMNRDSRWSKILIIAVLIGIVILSVILTSSTWKMFFDCLGHYKGLNLGLQR